MPNIENEDYPNVGSPRKDKTGKRARETIGELVPLEGIFPQELMADQELPQPQRKKQMVDDQQIDVENGNEEEAVSKPPLTKTSEIYEYPIDSGFFY